MHRSTPGPGTVTMVPRSVRVLYGHDRQGAGHPRLDGQHSRHSRTRPLRVEPRSRSLPTSVLVGSGPHVASFSAGHRKDRPRAPQVWVPGTLRSIASLVAFDPRQRTLGACHASDHDRSTKLRGPVIARRDRHHVAIGDGDEHVAGAALQASMPGTVRIKSRLVRVQVRISNKRAAIAFDHPRRL